MNRLRQLHQSIQQIPFFKTTLLAVGPFVVGIDLLACLGATWKSAFTIAQVLYCIGIIGFLAIALCRNHGRMWDVLYGNLLPAAILLFLVAIVYDFVLSSYDISGLYWGPGFRTRIVAGFTVCTLIFMVFLTMLCCAKATLRNEIINEVTPPNPANAPNPAKAPNREVYARYFVLQQSWPWLVIISLPALVVEPVLDSKQREGWQFEPENDLFFGWLIGVAIGYGVFELLVWLRVFSSTKWFWGYARRLVFGELAANELTRAQYLEGNRLDENGNVQHLTNDEILKRQTSSMHLVTIVAYIFGVSLVLDGLLRLLGDSSDFRFASGLFGAIVVASTFFIGRSLLHADHTAAQDFLRSICWFVGLSCLLLLVGVIAKWYELGREHEPGYIHVDYTFIFTTALGIGFIMAILLAVYGFLVTRPNYWWHLGTLAVLVAAILLNGTRDKITVPGLDAYYAKKIEDRPNLNDYDPDPDNVKRKSIRDNQPAKHLLSSKIEILPNWLSQRKTTSRPKVLIVTTSGGASRASVWTVAVLDAMKQANPVMLNDVRLITGASGGMVGAACYISAWNDEIVDPRHPPARRDLADQFEKNYPDIMTPILTQLAMRDLPSLPLPCSLGYDRGRKLEQVFERICPSLEKTTFAALYENEKAGKIPSLAFTPFLVEDGRRVLISNVDLSRIALDLGPLNGLDWKPGQDQNPDNVLSRSGIEFFRLFPEAQTSFKVGTAARMNASFPYLSPSVPLPTNPPRRFMDAGVYDNYGVNLALMWITQNADWLETNTSGIALIQVRAFSNEIRLRNPSQTPNDGAVDPPNMWERGTQFLTSPPAAVDASRMAINYFRNDGQIENLSRWFDLRKGQGYFQTFVFSYDQEIDGVEKDQNKKGGKSSSKHKRDKQPETLSWTLNSKELEGCFLEFSKDGEQEFNKNRQRLTDLVNWWQK